MACLLLIACLFGCQLTQNRRQAEVLGEMDALLNQGIAEARRQAEADPGGASAKILAQLRKTKQYVDQVESGEQEFDLEEMLALTQKSMALVKNLQSEFKLVLNADVAFRLGGYEAADLQAGGQRILDEFADSIVEAQLPEYREKFPEVPLMLVVSTTGYADAVAPGAALARELMALQTEPAPNDPLERRRHLNRLLSVRRSQTINRYIQDRLRSRLRQAGVAMGPPSVEGLGEAFPNPPETVSPPYRERDERRRICKIYSNVLIQ
jgi:hypothetical protein